MAIFWVTVAGVLLLDRAVKLLALNGLAYGELAVIWQGVLELRLLRNQGMALGLLSGETIAVIVLPVLAMFVGWLVLRRYRATNFTRAASALVVGGFLGNLADRLLFGYVTDMIYFPWMPWYVCNLADIAICVGVALLALSLLFRSRDWQLKTEGSANATDHLDGRA